MTKKILTIIAVIFLVIISLPQNAMAEYYDRNGNVIVNNSQQNTTQSNNKSVKIPGTIGVGKRKNSTDAYNYIIENQCETLATNLYLGETLYSCSNGSKFWSDVSVNPFIMVKNRKKSVDEQNAMSSASSMNPAVYAAPLFW